jgi:RNA polymerase subunit RPABC4/transcription elongation factor Spt4
MSEFATASCTSCKGHFEFERSTFEQSGEIDGFLTGQTITCPHCGVDTVLIIPKLAQPKLNRNEPPAAKTPAVRRPVQKNNPLNRNMRQCRDCGNEVSKNAKTCPQCGATQPKRTSVAAWGCLILVLPMMLMMFVSLYKSADMAEHGLTPAGESKPPPGPAVTVSKSGTVQDYGGTEITGKVHNNCTVELRHVEVRFSIFDKDGAKIGSARDSIDSIDPGGDWRYRAVATEKGGSNYRLEDISCNHGCLQYRELP